MKKKILKSALFAFIAILMVAPQAMALEIYVDDYGTVRFYQGAVLGDDDDRDSAGVWRKASDVSRSDYNNDRDNENRERQRTEIRESSPVKTLNSSARQRIEFNSEDGKEKLKVELREKDGEIRYKSDARSSDESNFKRKEEIEARTVDFSFPTDAKKARSTEDRVDYFKEKYSRRTDVQSLGEEDRDTAIEKRQEDYKEYLKKLQEERKERSEERVEIRDRVGENDEGPENRFEIQSRSTKAKLKGADFSYDTETGEVVLTTPSGEEHFLQHLPDQAIDRMTENGFFVDGDQEVEIETTEDGQVKYKSAAKKNKRFLGLFNRQIDTEVVLDDLTGEVVETETPTSVFANFLNSLSF